MSKHVEVVLGMQKRLQLISQIADDQEKGEGGGPNIEVFDAESEKFDAPN